MLIQFCCKGSRSEPYVKHNRIFLFHNDLKNASQNILIAGKRVGVFFIGEADGLIIAICPQIKTFFTQHPVLLLNTDLACFGIPTFSL